MAKHDAPDRQLDTPQVEVLSPQTMRAQLHDLQNAVQLRHTGVQKLERRDVLARMVGYVQPPSSQQRDEQPMVRTNGFTISSHRNDAVKTLAETAVIRSTYVRWCGGTAVKAASYPISKQATNPILREEPLRPHTALLAKSPLYPSKCYKRYASPRRLLQGTLSTIRTSRYIRNCWRA